MGCLSPQPAERETSCSQRQDITLPPASCPDHPLQEPKPSLLATNILGNLLPNLGTSDNQAGEYSEYNPAPQQRVQEPLTTALISS